MSMPGCVVDKRDLLRPNSSKSSPSWAEPSRRRAGWPKLDFVPKPRGVPIAFATVPNRARGAEESEATRCSEGDGYAEVRTRSMGEF